MLLYDDDIPDLDAGTGLQCWTGRQPAPSDMFVC